MEENLLDYLPLFTPWIFQFLRIYVKCKLYSYPTTSDSNSEAIERHLKQG